MQRHDAQMVVEGELRNGSRCAPVGVVLDGCDDARPLLHRAARHPSFAFSRTARDHSIPRAAYSRTQLGYLAQNHIRQLHDVWYIAIATGITTNKQQRRHHVHLVAHSRIGRTGQDRLAGKRVRDW